MKYEDEYQQIRVDEDNINLGELRNDKFMPNANRIDNQNFIEDYRALKQQQKEFLLKINMSTKLKQKIFDFSDTKEASKPDENQKLVALIDPFKGRLIMKERVWIQIEKQKQEERVNNEIRIAQEHEEQEKVKKKLQKSMKKAKKEQKIDSKNSEHLEKQNLQEKEHSQEKRDLEQNFLGVLLKKFATKNERQVEEQKQKKNNNILGQINEQDSSIHERVQSQNRMGSAEKMIHKKEGARQQVNKIPKPFEPSKVKEQKSKRDTKNKNQPVKGEKNSKQLGSFKKQLENTRMDSKAQFMTKYIEDQDLLSEIPRKELKEEFSNPHLRESPYDAEDQEHMAKSKRKNKYGREY